MKQTPKRSVYISKVKRFARSKAGLKKLRAIAPEVARMIEKHPEYLDISQRQNDPRVSGNYINSIYDTVMYTGESGNVYLRLCEHVYNFLTDEQYYGTTYKPGNGMTANFEILALHITNQDMREFIEEKVIEKFHPLYQYTAPDDPDYGKDKPLQEGQTRETIRADLCIYAELRAKRFRLLEAEKRGKSDAAS